MTRDFITNFVLDLPITSSLNSSTRTTDTETEFNSLSNKPLYLYTNYGNTQNDDTSMNSTTQMHPSESNESLKENDQHHQTVQSFHDYLDSLDEIKLDSSIQLTSRLIVIDEEESLEDQDEIQIEEEEDRLSFDSFSDSSVDHVDLTQLDSLGNYKDSSDQFEDCIDSLRMMEIK